jgi:hypothetical protein
VRAKYERAETEARLTDVNAIFLQGIAELLELWARMVKDRAYLAQERTAARDRPSGRGQPLSQWSLGARKFRRINVQGGRHCAGVDEL